MIALFLLCLQLSSLSALNTLSDISIENGHIDGNWLLFSENCELNGESLEHFEVAIISNDEIKNFFSNESSLPECLGVRLISGTPDDMAQFVLPRNLYKSTVSLSEWLSDITSLEIGWLSYYEEELEIFWVPASGPRRSVGLLKSGESNTVWIETRLSHRFEIDIVATGEVIESYLVKYDSFNIVGTPVPPDEPISEQNIIDQVNYTLGLEYDRSLKIKRTFTPFGFAKGKIPNDLYCSILTYYYNNYFSAGIVVSLCKYCTTVNTCSYPIHTYLHLHTYTIYL